MTNGSLMKVESNAECSKGMQNAPLGAFCNTFDMHLAIIGLENQFAVFLRVAVLRRFYCTFCRIRLVKHSTLLYPIKSSILYVIESWRISFCQSKGVAGYNY